MGSSAGNMDGSAGNMEKRRGREGLWENKWRIVMENEQLRKEYWQEKLIRSVLCRGEVE